MKTVIAMAVAVVSLGAWAGTTYTWTGAGGSSWSSTSNWSSSTGVSGYPHAADDIAVFNATANVTLAEDTTNGCIKVTGSASVSIANAKLVVDRLQVDRNAYLTVVRGSKAFGIDYVVADGGGKIDGVTFPLQNQVFLTATSTVPDVLPMTFVNCVIPQGSEAMVTVNGTLDSHYTARFTSNSIVLKLGGGIVHIR